MALRSEYQRVKDEMTFGISLKERDNIKLAEKIHEEAEKVLEKGSDTFGSDVPLTAFVKKHMQSHHLKLTLTNPPTSGDTPGQYKYWYTVEFVDLD